MKKFLASIAAATALMVLAGCGTTNVDMNYKGMDTSNGKPIAYVNTSVSACHLFGVWPLFWDASYTNTFNEFMKEAKRLNGTKVDIVTSDSEKNYVVGVMTFYILTPVKTTVAGNVYH